MFKNIYFGKVVLVTGHTGFKGTWLITWLTMLGARVYGLSDHVLAGTSHFSSIQKELDLKGEFWGDIADQAFFERVYNQVCPDFLFNLAAQAIVGKSYAVPFETWRTNTLGTVNILDVVRKSSNQCSCIMITSDKCYENTEWIWGYRENDTLGGSDPYSSSKGAAELAISSFKRSYEKELSGNVQVTSARAGNVLGGGDWSEGRIVPDIIRAWQSDAILYIRSGKATRPWQHVLEPLSGYLTLGQKLYEKAENINGSFNFGPEFQEDIPVSTLVDEISKFLPEFQYEIGSPEEVQFSEAGLLRLNCDKAANYLSWRPTLNFSETIAFTANWYVDYYDYNSNVLKITRNQIQKYVDIACNRKISWAKND